MPTDEDLDEMSMKVAGVLFAHLPGPNEKARIMELSLMADMACDTREATNFLELIKLQLSELNGTLEPVAEWFEKSRLFEGEIRVRS